MGAAAVASLNSAEHHVQQHSWRRLDPSEDDEAPLHTSSSAQKTPYATVPARKVSPSARPARPECPARPACPA
eukprot:6545926-Lingulodinium_polyedra.AAC.1